MTTNHTMQQELAGLRARVQELEGEGRASRRGALRLAGAAAVGGAAALLGSSPAAAATGAMQFGASNNAGSTQTTLSSTATTTLAVNSVGGRGVNAISTGAGTGVLGRVDDPLANGFGVWGIALGSLGYGVVAEGGQAQLYLTPGTGLGPSNAVFHGAGEVAYDDTTNALWACVAQGTPGTWRKLAGPTSAGSFHAIVPARVYDSRKAAPGPQSTLATGASRTISVADGRDPSTGAVTGANVVPAGATAIAYNLTVVNTVGTNGFLAVNDGGNTTVTASAINWSAAGLSLANGSVVKLDGSRQITVICGGTSTSCNFIVDVVGYYL